MKKGQNVSNEKPYFQAGLGGKITSQDLHDMVSMWGGNGKSLHQQCKNLKRKKKRKK